MEILARLQHVEVLVAALLAVSFVQAAHYIINVRNVMR
jgi:hypothetical protein